MGYFPNGDAGEYFAAKNCAHCKHRPDDEEQDICPVMAAHLIYNYDQFEDEKLAGVLGLLIPRDKVGQNEGCAMFLARNPDRCRETPDMFGGVQ